MTLRTHSVISSYSNSPILPKSQLAHLLSVPFRDSMFIVMTTLSLTRPCPARVPFMNGDLNFHIGDKVVYPNHGVGVIEQISSRSIGATVEKFYLLNIKASSLKVMVPCNNVGSVGIRRVVRNGEVQKILDFLSVADDLALPTGKTASRRIPTACGPVLCSRLPESSRA